MIRATHSSIVVALAGFGLFAGGAARANDPRIELQIVHAHRLSSTFRSPRMGDHASASQALHGWVDKVEAETSKVGEKSRFDVRAQTDGPGNKPVLSTRTIVEGPNGVLLRARDGREHQHTVTAAGGHESWTTIDKDGAGYKVYRESSRRVSIDAVARFLRQCFGADSVKQLVADRLPIYLERTAIRESANGRIERRVQNAIRAGGMFGTIGDDDLAAINAVEKSSTR
jgi:hypothetical protein